MAMSMCLADENDRINLHPTLQNVNSVLKILYSLYSLQCEFLQFSHVHRPS